MSKRKKRLQKIRQNPKAVTFDDMRSVMEDLGFQLKHITGSHHIFEHPDVSDKFSLPFQRPHVNSVYVKRLLELIQQLVNDMPDEEDTDE